MTQTLGLAYFRTSREQILHMSLCCCTARWAFLTLSSAWTIAESNRPKGGAPSLTAAPFFLSILSHSGSAPSSALSSRSRFHRPASPVRLSAARASEHGGQPALFSGASGPVQHGNRTCLVPSLVFWPGRICIRRLRSLYAHTAGFLCPRLHGMYFDVTAPQRLFDDPTNNGGELLKKGKLLQPDRIMANHSCARGVRSFETVLPRRSGKRIPGTVS